MSIIAIAALTLGLASPVVVEDPKPAEARPAATAYQPAESTRVCIRGKITGSILQQKVCDTLKNWKAQGIDPFKR